MEWEEDSVKDTNQGRWWVKSVKGMLLLAAYAIIIVLIVGGSMIHRKQQAKKPEPISEPISEPVPYSPPPEPMEPAALAALEAFFEAPDLPAKVALVRDAARVRPMIEDFHRTRGHPFPTLGTVSPGQSTTIDAKPMVMFEVEPFSGPRYYVAVVWDGHRFAVDWESLTAYGTMDWIEFLENKPAAPQTMRVFIREAATTAKPPGRTEAATFFQVEHRDHDQPLVVAAGAVAKTLRPLAENRRVPVTLELIWEIPESGAAAIPWVERFVAEGWSP